MVSTKALKHCKEQL